MDVSINLTSESLERAALACPMIDPKCLRDVAAMDRDCLTTPRGRVLLSCYQGMVREGVTDLDMLIVSDWAIRHDLEAELGGIEYLATLEEESPFTGHVTRYVRELDRYRKRREVVHYAEVVQSGPSDERIELLRSAVLSMCEAEESEWVGGSDLAGLIGSEAASETISTGMPSLDGLLGGGLGRGQLVVVAALTGYGKSSLAGQWAVHSGVEQGRRVMMFSLEMDASEVGCRMAAHLSGCSWNRIRDREVPEWQQSAVDMAVEKIGSSSVMVADSSRCSISDISSLARSAARDPLGLVVVDYLQLMKTERRDSRALEIGSVTRGLKMLARDIGVPIVLISQLSRAAADSSKPRLEHLKESSSIEQDADVVVLIDKAHMGATEVDVRVEKNRHGPVGMVKMGWDGPTMMFRDPGLGPSI